MKPKKIIILTALIILILTITSCNYTTNKTNNLNENSTNKEYTDNKSTICFDATCFEIEIATTPQERQTGLMNKDTMPENKGMLFVFQEQKKHTFWMKNTTIPLDIIWLDENMQVIHIEQAKPCTKIPCETYKPNQNALYVLEINQGLADENNIQKGSHAQLNSNS